MWANALRRVLGSRTLLRSPSFVTRSFAAGVVGALAVAGAALGATLTVNTTDDELNTDGDCSLREAIQAANTDAAVDACVAENRRIAEALGSTRAVILRNHGLLTVGDSVAEAVPRNPFVQRRQANTKVGGNLRTGQPAGQGQPYRLMSKFIAASRCHVRPP